MVIWSGKAWKSAAPGGGAGNIGTSVADGEVTPKTLGAKIWLDSRDTLGAVYGDNPPTFAPTKTNSSTTGDEIEYWADLSGNSNDMDHVGAPGGFEAWWMEDPVFGSEPALLNGHNYIRRSAFSTTHHFILNSADSSVGDFNIDDDYTFAFLLSLNNNANFQRAFDKSDNTKGYGMIWQSKWTIFHGSNADGYVVVEDQTADYTQNAWYFYVLRKTTATNAAAYDLRRNATARTLTTVGDPALTTAINNTAVLSPNRRVSNPAPAAANSIYVWAMWDRRLTDTEVTSLEQEYIKPNFGVIP